MDCQPAPAMSGIDLEVLKRDGCSPQRKSMAHRARLLRMLRAISRLLPGKTRVRVVDGGARKFRAAGFRQTRRVRAGHAVDPLPSYIARESAQTNPV